MEPSKLDGIGMTISLCSGQGRLDINQVAYVGSCDKREKSAVFAVDCFFLNTKVTCSEMNKESFY